MIPNPYNCTITLSQLSLGVCVWPYVKISALLGLEDWCRSLVCGRHNKCLTTSVEDCLVVIPATIPNLNGFLVLGVHVAIVLFIVVILVVVVTVLIVVVTSDHWQNVSIATEQCICFFVEVEEENFLHHTTKANILKDGVSLGDCTHCLDNKIYRQQHLSVVVYDWRAEVLKVWMHSNPCSLLISKEDITLLLASGMVPSSQWLLCSSGTLCTHLWCI